jgi:demethylmenaquinone methyltransferase / 2-methoxy-6-polyprenyl-1,4-benzoquinol methylase
MAAERGAGPGAGAAPGRLEAEQVQQMFDRIAGCYDVLNSAMSAGLHRRWRKRAADLARVGAGSRVLDVATGTGDFALELAARISPGGEVLGSDFSEGMLRRAREKADAVHALGAMEAVPRFEHGDALALPYDDDSFDAATVGFGIRNFADLQRGLAEMARVVRPGGRVVILEMTTPTKPPLSVFFGVWFDRMIPALAKLLDLIAGARAQLLGSSGHEGIAQAYSYLPSSVKRFPPAAELAAEMERAGIREITYLLTAGGIIAIHAGTVSAEATG